MTLERLENNRTLSTVIKYNLYSLVPKEGFEIRMTNFFHYFSFEEMSSEGLTASAISLP